MLVNCVSGLWRNVNNSASIYVIRQCDQTVAQETARIVGLCASRQCDMIVTVML